MKHGQIKGEIMTTFQATLSGRPIGRGTYVEVRADIARLVTLDADRHPETAQRVNLALSNGTAKQYVLRDGSWSTEIPGRGTLVLTREG